MEKPDSIERIKHAGIIAWAWVGIIVLIGILIYALHSIYSVLMPFLYALFFVYVLRPAVNFLSSKGVPRIIALILSYLGLILILALFGMYVGPILYKETNGFISKLPSYVTVANGYINDLVRDHPFLKGEQATELLTSLSNSFKGFLQRLASSIPMMTKSIFGGVLNFVLAPIIAFYILKDYEAIRTNISEMIPARHRTEGMEIIKKIDCIVGGFLKGQALVALSVAILSGIALAALGVDYAVLLGFIIGIFNIIPYLGPILGGAPAVIIALGTSWQLAVVVIVILLIVQQIDSMFISPRIMSSQVNLHPAVVIFALLAGETLLGVIGMLIAIPLAAVGKALYLHFRERNNKRTEEPDVCDLEASKV
ncbi:MAG: AI-2E family transporter [Firmicutes bacterium]|nr:AI-2E family transporter [Bacillota bacterium]